MMVIAADRRAAAAKVQRALRALGGVLLMVASKANGQLAGEARLALLYAFDDFDTPAAVVRVLSWVIDVDLVVSNWHDVMEPRKNKSTAELGAVRNTGLYLSEFRLVVDAQGPSEDEQAVARTLVLLKERETLFTEKVDTEDEAFHTEVIEPAQEAVTVAYDAVLELADVLIGSAPSEVES